MPCTSRSARSYSGDWQPSESYSTSRTLANPLAEPAPGVMALGSEAARVPSSGRSRGPASAVNHVHDKILVLLRLPRPRTNEGAAVGVVFTRPAPTAS